MTGPRTAAAALLLVLAGCSDDFPVAEPPLEFAQRAYHGVLIRYLLSGRRRLTVNGYPAPVHGVVA